MAKSKRPAAASQNPVAPASQNRFYLAIGAIALVLVVVAVLLSRGEGDAAMVPVDAEFSSDEIQTAPGVAMGDDSAPVVLYEFADYQCPHCAQFATFIQPLIKERLIDTGVLRMVRYDFPLLQFPYSFLAARAARCAEDAGKYWEYHDVLYGRQPTWSSAAGTPTDEFIDYAEAIGIDRNSFAQCLRSDEHAAEVTRNLRLGESLGVRGTPTLFLNGERIEVSDFNELEQRVREAAGAVPATP